MTGKGFSPLNSATPGCTGALSAQQVFYAVALFMQFLQRGVHARAREIADVDAFDDLEFAVLAGHRLAVDYAFGDAVAAIGGNPHGNPVALGGSRYQVAHLISGRAGAAAGR